MSRRRPATPSANAGSDTALGSPLLRDDAPWMLACGVAWVVLFCVMFYRMTLPNNHLTRLEVWAAIPGHFLDLAFPPEREDGPPRGARFLAQRLPLLATSLAILVTAFCVGRLLLRLLKLQDEQTQVERHVYAFGLGLSTLSLLTLGAGLAGLLFRVVLGGLLGAAVLAEMALTWRRRGTTGPSDRSPSLFASPDAELLLRLGTYAWMVPFFVWMLLGGMLPETDFDVKEYHLEGPKEYYQSGRIAFLPHNVYTSFPFGTEMLSLLAMVLHGDWYWGGVAGKATLTWFGPLTALAVFAMARRCFGSTAGWLAATIFLTTPWIYRISTIAYAEGGLSFYLAAALLASLRVIERARAGQQCGRMAFVAGLLAGSAMACKYPGVVSVVIPLGAAMMVAPWLRRSEVAALPETRGPATPQAVSGGGGAVKVALRTACIYSAGVLVAVGPWLLKNLAETGNPVYPLLFSVFGGADWDAATDARWRKAHSPADYDVAKLWFWLTDVSARNDWLSPLLYAFAPLTLLEPLRGVMLRWRDKVRHRTSVLLPAMAGGRPVVGLWAYAIFLFATWWLLTHRLDRFWVPMLPVVAALAGGGAALGRGLLWTTFVWVAVSVNAFFNLGVATSGLSGYNDYRVDLTAAREFTAGFTAPGIARINQAIARGTLPAETRVLCVGEAQVFDANFPLDYNTAFDRSIFQEWCGQPSPGTTDRDEPLRDADEIRATLRERGITHVLVNWGEILRYRLSYGYSDFVTPQRFDDLLEAGVLGEPIVRDFGDATKLSPSQLGEIERWGPRLKKVVPGLPTTWTSLEVYPVLK